MLALDVASSHGKVHRAPGLPAQCQGKNLEYCAIFARLHLIRIHAAYIVPGRPFQGFVFSGVIFFLFFRFFSFFLVPRRCRCWVCRLNSTFSHLTTVLVVLRVNALVQSAYSIRFICS